MNNYYHDNGWIDLRYLDLEGNPVKRTKETHSYSYDPYVVWKGKYNKEKDSAVYSDRIMQWDYDKFNSCCGEVWGNKGQYFSSRSPESIEKFLNLYFEFDKKVKLTAILEGCNVSNGYPYWVFYYN